MTSAAVAAAPRVRAGAPRIALTALLLAACLGGCMSLEYDLAAVDVPVSAKSAPPEAQSEAFVLKRKDVLWVHGLFGRKRPDVGALLAEQVGGAREVTDLRVRHAATFHDWLATHLSLSLVRMKTVTIEGRLVLDD